MSYRKRRLFQVTAAIDVVIFTAVGLLAGYGVLSSRAAGVAMIAAVTVSAALLMRMSLKGR